MTSHASFSQRLKLSAFQWFSYFDTCLHIILNILPPILRTAYYRLSCAKFGKRVLIDYGTYIRYPHKVFIGNDVAINRGCRFYPSLSRKDAVIEVGDRVIIGPNVTFFGAGQDPRQTDFPDIAGSIRVKSDVYIGGNSTIRYGVSIGQGAVIAAGSIIVKDVDPWTIVGGSPGRLISRRNPQNSIGGITKLD